MTRAVHANKTPAQCAKANIEAAIRIAGLLNEPTRAQTMCPHPSIVLMSELRNALAYVQQIQQ